MTQASNYFPVILDTAEPSVMAQGSVRKAQERITDPLFSYEMPPNFTSITLNEPISERQPGESLLWYSRFWEYLIMGRKRSILAVYKHFRSTRIDQKRREKARKGVIKSVPQSWADNAEKWQWRRRALAWDLQQIEEQRREWLEQYEKDREIEYEIGQALMDRADEMLSYPLTKIEYITGYEIVRDPLERRRLLQEAGMKPEKIEDLGDVPIIVVQMTCIHPARWNFRDAAILAEIGARLQRQATGYPTSYEQKELTLDSDNKDAIRRLFPLKE